MYVHTVGLTEGTNYREGDIRTEGIYTWRDTHSGIHLGREIHLVHSPDGTYTCTQLCITVGNDIKSNMRMA